MNIWESELGIDALNAIIKLADIQEQLLKEKNKTNELLNEMVISLNEANRLKNVELLQERESLGMMHQASNTIQGINIYDYPDDELDEDDVDEGLDI